MRIIGGEFRGHKLASVGKGDAGAHLRPTADRVRESLFNRLAGGFGSPFESAVVLDLFAGTGALGLEALSRGAAKAVFVENGRTALRLLNRNIEICRVEERARVIRRDARKPGAPTGDPATLVFLDPPYGKGLGEAALSAALAGGWIAPGALIVCEEGVDITPPEGLHLLDSRRYGDTVIHILERSD
ncbi:MAG: 16S rRNA (guanine(966)-N(2))-methyltransferase RsmD [Pseudomonadota bacterium]|uniref:16S rRNA (guanine(966)-N(2))-methyltransferase RsmD n=1 Tax=Roseovarius TaxID=74030 RepID=UPI0022A8889D|nr:16S rRNA (guanine(966)-N(2))-methyltransferase RsmD [Roseovarius sp. EGI FJ00037]MCZ0813407.1 16S rRNA (guanine(966)-N(2))-methyltransferase RsmD [Roseovarius sp. EGI FJ00037]